MSIEVMRYVWKNSKSKSNARLMLLAIADIANDNGDAYPGVDKLGNKCNISHRCAQDVIQDLERLQELQVYENVGTKTISGWTNLYRVVLEGVDQGSVRNPRGEIAKPRSITIKKSKSFPKGMQIVAPLEDEGMQIVAPDEVQTVAPDDVQIVAPKALEYPSEDTSVNTSAKVAGNLIFEAVAKYVFDVTDFSGLDKGVKARFGLMAKTATRLAKSRMPDVTNERIAQLVSNFAAAEKFKPGIQGTTNFQLKFAAYLEKKQNTAATPINPAHVPFIPETIDDAVEMPPEAREALENLKRKIWVSEEALYEYRKHPAA